MPRLTAAEKKRIVKSRTVTKKKPAKNKFKPIKPKRKTENV